jgi:hypothetical protein
MSKHSILAEKLNAGETIKYKEYGNSMLPKLKSGVEVVVEPCKLEDVKVGDIVFSKVKSAYYLHYVKQIGNDGRVMIGNAHGYNNGWTRKIFGKLIDFTNP